MPVPASALSFSTLELGYGGDSNAGRAASSGDVFPTDSIAVDLGINLHRIAFDGTVSDIDAGPSGALRLLSFDASAGYLRNLDIEELDRARVKFSTAFSSESRARRLSPLFSVGLSLGYEDFSSELRDASTVDVFASVNLQPFPALDTLIGIGHEWRTAADNDVFTTAKARVFTQLRYAPVPRLGLRVGASFFMGDEVSSAEPESGNDIYGTWTVTSAWYGRSVWDDAFSNDGTGRYAYRIEDAESVLLEIGAVYDVTATTSIDLFGRSVSTDAPSGVSYDRDLFGVVLSLRF